MTEASPKKVLIVAPTFYPDWRVAAVRITQFARHLPEFGWDPHVLCRYYDAYASRACLDRYVHPAVEIEYFNPPSVTELEQTDQASKRSLLRQAVTQSGLDQFMVPDPAIAFYRRMRQRTLDAVRRIQPHVILTTSPQHSLHDLGLWIKRQTGIPWVADWRDAYTVDPRFRSRGLASLVQHKHRQLERTVFENASLSVHAIPIHARWARQRYPFARKRIRVLMNGVPEDIDQALAAPIPPPAGRKAIRVIGWPGDETTVTVGEAVKHQLTQGQHLQLELIGRKPTTAETLETLLGDHVTMYGRQPHQEALRYMAGADVLLCVLTPSRASQIGLSSKLFEFLATGRPIIVVNPTRSDRHLLRGLRGVQTLTNPSTAEVSQALGKALMPEGRPPAEQAEQIRTHYSRRTQTSLLAHWMESLVDGPTSASEPTPGAATADRPSPKAD